MKVTYMLVTSLDGRTTQGRAPGVNWASPEDQQMFKNQLTAFDCILMGSATYKAARAIIQPSPERPRIVLTHAPQSFRADEQPGLAFVHATATAVVEQAQRDGHTSVLLLGGAKTAAQFFNAGLVDEVRVTIEPMLFGAGEPFVAMLQTAAQLQLVNCQQLNSKGSLLATYRVHKKVSKDLYDN